MNLVKLILTIILLNCSSNALKTEGFCDSDCVDTYFPNEYLQRWMSALSDNIPMRSLSVPGTHNSGAFIKGSGGWTKAQEMRINELLQLGTRYLDIRCRHINNTFTIHHNEYYLNLNFYDVLSMVSKFLNSNPSETILMRIRIPEYDDSGNNRTYSDTMIDYINKFKTYFWIYNNSNPNLGQIRGKIVIIQNFPGLPRFGPDLGSFDLQDEYKVAFPSIKWNAIKQMIDKNVTQSVGKINHLSGSGLLTPLLIALYINDKMLTFMNKNQFFYGIIPADFPTFKLLNAVAYANCYSKMIYRDQSKTNIDWKSTYFLWSKMFGTSEHVYFEDKQPSQLMSVRKVLVQAGSCLFSIQLFLSDDLNSYYTAKHGSDRGIQHEFNVPIGEVITEIELFVSDKVESITFITDKRTRSQSYGNKSIFGIKHRVTFPNCGQLAGLAGKASNMRIETLKFMTMNRNYFN